VQAAPGLDYSTKVYLYVRKVQGEKTICVGDTVPLTASAIKAYEIVGEGPRLARLYGVPLETLVADPSIGVVTPETNVTSLDTDPVGEARFTFTAKKTGTTSITVNGMLNRKQLLGIVVSQEVVTGSAQVTVEACEYRVNATAVWHLQDISLTALIENAGLVADEGAEGQYHGNADVKWVGSTVYPPPCYVLHHPAPSRAYITGEKLGELLLEVKVVYEDTPALFSDLVCPEASVPMFGDKLLGPEDLQVWVPAFGGTSGTRHPELGGVEVLDSVAVVNVRVVNGK
jgi:hypothetical protein